MQIVEHPCDLWSWGSNFRFMGESFQDYSEFLGKYRKSAHICLSRKIIIASLNYLNTTWKLFNIFYGSMQVYDLNFYSSVFTSGADLERGFICIKVCVWGGGGGGSSKPPLDRPLHPCWFKPLSVCISMHLYEQQRLWQDCMGESFQDYS